MTSSAITRWGRGSRTSAQSVTTRRCVCVWSDRNLQGRDLLACGELSLSRFFQIAGSTASPALRWFGVAVTAFVTLTKLSYVEPGYYWDWWRPLTGLPSGLFIQATQAHSAWPSLLRRGAMSTGNGFGHLWEETAPLKLQPHGAK